MKRIAIIDDEQDVLNVLKKLFGRYEEFEVDTYVNSKEGFKALQENEYDLLLLDVMMPEFNGLELLVELRKENKDIIVIIMTAYNILEKSIEAHKYGANDYLEKPFKSIAHVKDKVFGELGL